MRHLASLLVLATGCLAHPTDPDPTADPTDPTDPSDPTDPTDPPPPPEPVASGSYHLQSRIDITVEALLPEPAEQLVVTLRDFSTAPAHTLITLADEAGVPAVSELRAALPDSLESRLEGWIDGEIAKLTLGGVPITQLAGEAAARAETALTEVALDSTLAIAGTTATHALTQLDFTPAGIDAQLPLAQLPADIVTATATATSQHATLALGDHRFSLSYGDYVWRALDTACTAAHGAGIRATLGAVINCPALATRIANKCVLGICVGHAAQLTELCERGLDEVVEQARAKVTALRFDALHFAAGTATVSTDASRLDAGVWTAEINAGQGLRHVPATFTGQR